MSKSTIKGNYGVAVRVSDIEKAEAFYREIRGRTGNRVQRRLAFGTSYLF